MTTAERRYLNLSPTLREPTEYPLGRPQYATNGEMAVVAALIVVAERIDALTTTLRKIAKAQSEAGAS